jgi:hypothetical protein
MLRESKHLLIRLRPSGQASVVSGPLATSVACLGPGHGRKASSRMCGAGARPYMLVLKFACLSVGGRCGAMYIVPRPTHTHTHTHTHTQLVHRGYSHLGSHQAALGVRIGLVTMTLCGGHSGGQETRESYDSPNGPTERLPGGRAL